MWDASMRCVPGCCCPPTCAPPHHRPGRITPRPGVTGPGVTAEPSAGHRGSAKLSRSEHQDRHRQPGGPVRDLGDHLPDPDPPERRVPPPLPSSPAAGVGAGAALLTGHTVRPHPEMSDDPGHHPMPVSQPPRAAPIPVKVGCCRFPIIALRGRSDPGRHLERPSGGAMRRGSPTPGDRRYWLSQCPATLTPAQCGGDLAPRPPGGETPAVWN